VGYEHGNRHVVFIQAGNFLCRRLAINFEGDPVPSVDKELVKDVGRQRQKRNKVTEIASARSGEALLVEC
jgi:tRNA-binding EMAP/Myf-like protein